MSQQPVNALPAELGAYDYRAVPLGSLPGEAGLQSPYNLRPDMVIVKVRNLSAIHKHRIVREAVSIRRGGNEQLKDRHGKETWGSNVSPAELQFRVAQGEDVNWYEDKIVPQDFILRHDGRRYLIPAIDPKTGENAPWITVPAGAWDLYMGNWDRMHSPSAKERATELEMLGVRGFSKWVADDDNSFGFLEFSREIVRVETATVDAALVRSGRLIEV